MQPRGGCACSQTGKYGANLPKALYCTSYQKNTVHGNWAGGCASKSRFALSVREGQPVRPERAGAAATAAAVFSVAQQRQAARGKLDADLVRAPRFEPDARKAQSILFGKDFIVQPRLLHAAALPPDHVGFVFRPVMEQQIFQCPGLSAGQPVRTARYVFCICPCPIACVRRAASCAVFA